MGEASPGLEVEMKKRGRSSGRMLLTNTLLAPPPLQQGNHPQEQQQQQQQQKSSSASASAPPRFSSPPLKSKSWADIAIAWLVQLPARIAFFLDVLSRVSVSLALLNSLPVYGLDGQHAAVQFIRLWLLSAPPPSRPALSAPHKTTSSSSSSVSSSSSSLLNARTSCEGTGGRKRPRANAGASTSTLFPASPRPDMCAEPVNGGGGSGSVDNGASLLEKELRKERYHDWNALHMRQRRLTRAILGCCTALLAVHMTLGGIGAMYQHI